MYRGQGRQKTGEPRETGEGLQDPGEGDRRQETGRQETGEGDRRQEKDGRRQGRETGDRRRTAEDREGRQETGEGRQETGKGDRRQEKDGSSLGRYVFGSEISYNKAPPRLPGLGC